MIILPHNLRQSPFSLANSGKPALAARPSLHSEGQRGTSESLSTYTRQFLGVMHKPDVSVDTIIHEIYAKSQRDIRQYSTLFSFIDSKRTFESTVISCHDPMNDIEGAPQSGFVINDQRVYEELLIFNDSLISTSLARDRIKEGEF